MTQRNPTEPFVRNAHTRARVMSVSYQRFRTVPLRREMLKNTISLSLKKGRSSRSTTTDSERNRGSVRLLRLLRLVQVRSATGSSSLPSIGSVIEDNTMIIICNKTGDRRLPQPLPWMVRSAQVEDGQAGSREVSPRVNSDWVSIQIEPKAPPYPPPAPLFLPRLAPTSSPRDGPHKKVAQKRVRTHKATPPGGFPATT
jgi:hypothetical protein